MKALRFCKNGSEHCKLSLLLVCSDLNRFLNGLFCRIGVVSGKAIFGPPLDQYWKEKLEGEAAAKEATEKSSD